MDTYAGHRRDSLFRFQIQQSQQRFEQPISLAFSWYHLVSNFDIRTGSKYLNMKWIAILFFALTLLVLTVGTPTSTQRTETGHFWGSAQRVLPMTFDHVDHKGHNCINCHHNFADNTGNSVCMHCHVANKDLEKLLQQQFHGLCMGCHVEMQIRGEEHGPIRQCIKCHTAEDRP